MSPSQSTSYASGQQAPKWPADKPLALQINHFSPVREGHPPPGTVPDEIVAEGEERPLLFHSVQLPVSRLTLKNAIVVSPMCQYSVVDGYPSPYHLAHLGSFALHGAGTIMVEASGVTSAGRITPQDLGIYKDDHIPAHTSLVSALKSFTEGLTVGVQLAHAGRKASTWSPFHRGERKVKEYVTDEEGGWTKEVVAPSALAWGKGWITPRALSTAEVKEVQKQFVDAAARAFESGYDFVELHAAHGYLLHSFLSPLSNQRTDEYGGSFENRSRLLIDTAKEIRAKFPERSLWVRVSATDYAEHVHAEGKQSWDIEQTKQLHKVLSQVGVDVLDVSGGGLVEFQKISPRPAYQLPYAHELSKNKLASPLLGTVGIMEGDEYPGQVAEKALEDGDASLVFFARGLLANPAWPEFAGANLLGVRPAGNPQYHRVHPVKPGETKGKKAPSTAQNHN
ncbi:FMN-linked oxidoreductase [Acaromyces ingoldii]|uniref:FMN-linked oxidoreductase n=1 Tax=Acaromyces ingoldii TaxID=215250 RepID=A0A316YGM6_9BASI|nr:FMN-linked oxidoreductase [Acaromyces ingoldii]PWN88379.1 FMN-linked oxidoreductase [Acaromyces ingoldii]